MTCMAETCGGRDARRQGDWPQQVRLYRRSMSIRPGMDRSIRIVADKRRTSIHAESDVRQCCRIHSDHSCPAVTTLNGRCSSACSVFIVIQNRTAPRRPRCSQGPDLVLPVASNDLTVRIPEPSPSKKSSTGLSGHSTTTVVETQNPQ